MLNKTNIKIALAHLTSRKKQAIIAVLSVTFGVSMYIFMNGFMGGVNKSQTEMTFSSLAHIRIFNDVDTKVNSLIDGGDNTIINLRNAKAIQYSEGIRNSKKIINDLITNKQLMAITSQINLSGTFRNGSAKLSGTISGIDVINEEKMFSMKRYVKEGSWDELKLSNNNIILGILLAEKLGLKLYDRVSITTSDNVIKNFKIICIIETGSPNVDSSKAFIKKSAALQLTSKNRNYVTDIQINVPDFNKATQVAQVLRNTSKHNYKIESWIESHGQLAAANTLRNIIAIAVSLVIIIVAGFGIYNIMNMTVNEKIKEIAILKAIGFDGHDVIQIFIIQAVIIGLLGGFLGIIFGYIVALAISHVPFSMPGLPTMPMVFNLFDYISAFLFGVSITVLAGYMPAKKAANIDPVDIIRG